MCIYSNVYIKSFIYDIEACTPYIYSYVFNIFIYYGLLHMSSGIFLKLPFIMVV